MLGNNTKEKKYINVKLTSVPGPVSNKNDAPKFVVLDENFTPTNTSYTSVEGTVTWVKSTFTPKKGKMGDIYGFKAFIENAEGTEVVVIESTITNASKDLLNSLLNAKDKVVKISLYLNKNGYPTSSVKTSDGAFVEGALDFKSLTPALLKENVDVIYKADKKESTSEINLEDIPF